MEWISIKDRLPEDDERIIIYDFQSMKVAKVLVFNGEVTVSSRMIVYNKSNFLGYQNTDNWFWTSCDEVTHWMPLPEPPKEATKP